jgi:hypothetical protein
VGHQDRIKKLTQYAEKNNLPDYYYDPDDSMSRQFGMTYGGGIVFIDRQWVVRSRTPKGFAPSLVEQEVRKVL